MQHVPDHYIFVEISALQEFAPKVTLLKSFREKRGIYRLQTRDSSFLPHASVRTRNDKLQLRSKFLKSHLESPRVLILSGWLP